MRPKDAAGHWLPRLLYRHQKALTRVQDAAGAATARTRTQRKRTTLSEAFHTRTYLYIEAVYADAFCLTGSREEAADLVVEAYLRAFRQYQQECRWTEDGRILSCFRAEGTLAWLYGNLHAVFCERILGHAAQDSLPTGGER